MRIGLFTDTFLPVVDGVGRVVSRYAEGLAERCEACYVITPGQQGHEPEPAEYRLLEFRSVGLLGLGPYRAGLPALSPRYKRCLAHTPMDIVHAHDPFAAGREALRIGRKRGVPVVGTFHSKYYDDLLQYTHSPWLARQGIRHIVGFYSRCDRVWAVSQATADVLRDYGYQGDVDIMMNGADLKTPDPAAVQAVNARYLLSDLPVLLYVGQMNWKKNIRRILETCAVLQDQGQAFRLILAGQGPSEREIREAVQTAGLEETVIFTGHIHEARILDGLYARASLLIFPSLYDNAPMVVREAAALGTPALLAAGSGAAEVIRDGINGLLAPDNTAAMAERIVWALARPEELRQIGREARRTIPQPWDAIMDEVIGRYEALIALRRRQLK